MANVTPIVVNQTRTQGEISGVWPKVQIIGNPLTGTGSWFNGLSSTPNTAIASPVVNTVSVPTAFVTKTNAGLMSKEYFMYSANTTVAQRRARTIQVIYRFTDNTNNQNITMNIPANQYIRIGIPNTAFTTVSYALLDTTQVTLNTLTPALGTLHDLFQEI